MEGRGKEILEQLLRGRTPEERERLSLAWERIATGDPDSLPVLFALSDRFSLEAHAALLGEMRSIHASLEGMAREIGQGASATVERTELAAEATLDHADRFGELIPKLEQIVTSQEEASTRAIGQVQAIAKDIDQALRAARQQYDRSGSWKLVGFLALLAALVAGIGFWSGGELRSWRERERIYELLHLSASGDNEAAQELSEHIKNYRERHKLLSGKTR